MKALSITHSNINKAVLLQKAEIIPGAWNGIRIAALLLLLSGWKSTQIAELFGLSRWSVVKWIHKTNREGLAAIEDHARSGRPSQFDEAILHDLDEALKKSPHAYGISRSRWDGVVIAHYLKQRHHIRIHVRHAQRLVKNLGYSLKRPIDRFVQASSQGVERFEEAVKKTPRGPAKQG
jgi:transposase